MSFRAVALVFALCLSSPAFAQLPDRLEQALAAEPGDLSPEALVMRMGLGVESIRIAISFEDEDVTYRLIEPATEAQLSETQAEMWAGFNRDEEEGEAEASGSEDEGEEDTASLSIGSYDPEALRESIGTSASLVSEADGLLVYAFTPITVPGQDGAPQEMIENLRGEAVVDADRGELVSIRFVLNGSFKPHMAARINEFELEQRFVHDPHLEGPRMAGVTMMMSGSSLFQPFSQSMQFDIEDVRYPQADSSDG